MLKRLILLAIIAAMPLQLFAKDSALVTPYYAQTQYLQTKLSPVQALDRLKAGNKRFVTGSMKDRKLLKIANYTSVKGQFPFAFVLSCLDSRSVPEIVFDQGLGDIFSARVAGNLVGRDVLGSMEFATKYAGVGLIVVMGHTHCGAVQAACTGKDFTKNLNKLLKQIRPAVKKTEKHAHSKDCASMKLVNAIAKQNVVNQINKILSKSKTIRGLVEAHKVIIVGAMHNIKTGQVEFFDQKG